MRPYSNQSALRVERLEDRVVPTAGNLDASFGTGGVRATNLLSYGGPKSLALQPDGKILVSTNEYDVALKVSIPLVLRYDASGLLDPTFGTNGKATQNRRGCAF